MKDMLKDYSDIVATNPPRLVVKHRFNEIREDQFEWGVVGGIPILTLIGCIGRVQTELSTDVMHACDEMALVIAWDPKRKTTLCCVNSAIPIDPLIGMLEVIKSILVSSRVAQMSGSQKRIVGPDGQPMR